MTQIAARTLLPSRWRRMKTKIFVWVNDVLPTKVVTWSLAIFEPRLRSCYAVEHALLCIAQASIAGIRVAQLPGL